VAPNGDIFVAEGHSSNATANARILKFDRTGKLLKTFGSFGTGQGQFDQPHALAMDSRGRLVTTLCALGLLVTCPRTAPRMHGVGF
jgi:hypothetical protein